MRDQCARPSLARGDAGRQSCVREGPCRATVTGHVGGPSVEIAKRACQMFNTPPHFETLIKAGGVVTRVLDHLSHKDRVFFAAPDHRRRRLAAQRRHKPGLIFGRAISDRLVAYLMDYY